MYYALCLAVGREWRGVAGLVILYYFILLLLVNYSSVLNNWLKLVNNGQEHGSHLKRQLLFLYLAQVKLVTICNEHTGS